MIVWFPSTSGWKEMNDIGYECCYCLLYFAKFKKKLKTIFIWFCFVFHGCAYFWSVLSRQSDAKKKKKRMKIPKGLLELEVQTIPMSKKKDEENLQTMIHKTLRQKN
jgi:hypothetical protein